MPSKGSSGARVEPKKGDAILRGVRRESKREVLLMREISAAESDARALLALDDPGTHLAVVDAFRRITLDGHGRDRNPIDALADAEHVLAAVRAWARRRARVAAPGSSSR